MNTLSIQFTGGPGNRLFQYHTATYLAKLWNKQFVVDPNLEIKNGLHHDPEFNINNFFKCKTKTIKTYDTIIKQRPNGKWDKNWINRLTSLKPKGNVLLTSGYYINIWDNHKTIPKLPHTSTTPNTIFVHVRRSDYLNSHLDLNLDYYYKEAYRILHKHHPNSKFIITSDDLNWCKNNMKYIANAVFFDKDYKTTWSMMSTCKAGILANSTFSLYGAYLAHVNDPNFHAIMPNKWNTPNTPGLVQNIAKPWIRPLEYKEISRYTKIVRRLKNSIRAQIT